MGDRSPTPGPSTVKSPPDAKRQKKQESEISREAREQGELLSSLAAMFPDAPLEYLEEQVRAELVLATYQQPKDMDKIFIAY